MIGLSPSLPGNFNAVPLVLTALAMFPSPSIARMFTVPWCSSESLSYQSLRFWLLVYFTTRFWLSSMTPSSSNASSRNA